MQRFPLHRRNSLEISNLLSSSWIIAGPTSLFGYCAPCLQGHFSYTVAANEIALVVYMCNSDQENIGLVNDQVQFFYEASIPICKLFAYVKHQL